MMHLLSDRDNVDDKDQDQANGNRHGGANVTPERDEESRGRNLRRNRNRVAVPVADGESESQSGVNKTGGEVRKGARLGNQRGELANALHDTPQNGSNNDVRPDASDQARDRRHSQKKTSRAGLGQRRTSSQEETSADASAKTEEGDMAGCESTLGAADTSNAVDLEQSLVLGFKRAVLHGSRL